MMKGTEALQRLSEISASSFDLAGRLRDRLRPVWELLTLRLMDGVIMPKTNLSVSLERGAIWVVVGSRFLSRITIRRFRRYAFDDGKYASPESLASTLALALKELKTSKAAVTLAIPREWTIVKAIELPAAVKETITDVIAYELDRLTPLSAEDACYDFKILNEHDGKVDLILVAARAGLVNQYKEALAREGVVLEKVTISLSNLATLCAYAGHEPDSICLEVDPYGYEGGLIRRNLLAQSVGGTFLPDETREATLVNALNPLIEMARAEGVTPAVLLSVKGEGSISLDRHLKVPVKVLENGATKLRLPQGAQNISSSAVGGIVDSLWPDAQGLNLFRKGLTEKARLPVACSVILVILILATSIPYALLPLQREQRRLDEINRQIAMRKDEIRRIEGLQKEFDALNAETATLEKFKESNPLALVLLKELTSILPKTVWLTRTRITDTTVDIEGYAGSASEILPKLEQSKYFKKVEFASPTIRDVRLNADRFVIKMEIEGFGTDEVEKPKEMGGKPVDGKKK